MKTAVIIGGGFGGIRAALDLGRRSDLEVILISKNTCFEYYPGLHKIVGVSQHATYAIPLATIFKNTKVRLVHDEVVSVDPSTKAVSISDGETFTPDFLILAVGSQTEYFGIPGLQETAFGFKSVGEAKKLRAHMQDAFKKYVHADKSESVVGLHFVVVGAGPNGVDVAGELASLADYFAARYKISRSLATIDLVEGSPRVLPMISESVSHRVEERLRELGVNILCNRDLVRDDAWTVTLADMKIGARTLVWTAGITTNELVKKIPGLTLGKKNRVAVDEYLQALPAGRQASSAEAGSFENFYVIGDAADTQYAGLAQTALYDAGFVTKVINAKLSGKALHAYIPKKPAYNIGVGPRWSVMVVGNITMYGLPAYIMRTLIDIKFFLSVLPVREVWKLYFR